MADVELLPLPWTLCHFHDETQELIRNYTRANVAPLQAENERLRAEAARLRRSLHEAVVHGNRQSGRAERLAEALRVAEAALADIGDADREPGDDIAWCEARAAKALPAVRAALAQEDRNG